MIKHQFFIASAILLLLVPTFRVSASEDDKGSSRALAKISTNDQYSPFLINNVLNFYYNNGGGSLNPFTHNSGFEFPKGSGKTILFSDGIMWGGFHKGELKVGGSWYSYGLQAGRINTPGTATTGPVAGSAASPLNRVYRVRPDINPSTSFSTIQQKIHDEEFSVLRRYLSTTEQQIYDQYIADWKEWPAVEGAPFQDRNGNGTYDWDTDIPGKPGSDQTLWYVANDLDSARTKGLTGSRPIGLEMQRTVWGYRGAGWMDNVIFVSTVIINKSGAPVDSMFIAQWADPDVGEATDDFVGCDTLRQMGYVYNAEEWDPQYGYPVPAYGAVVLQGPCVSSPADTAIFLGRRRLGFRNLPMYAFPLMGKSSAIFPDPIIGPPGAIQWYWGMNGCVFQTGEQFVDPTTGNIVKICLPGDPLTGSGWCDGSAWRPGDPPRSPSDRRFAISYGPFALANGDTQEIMVAHVGALGTNRLASIALLRSYADAARSLSQGLFEAIPPGVSFNVAYPSPSEARVSLVVDCQRSRPASVTVNLVSQSGVSIAEVPLADDGTLNDGIASDGIFGGDVSIPRQAEPLLVRIKTVSTTGQVQILEALSGRVSTAGQVLIRRVLIFSDNLNSDGQVNPGESIRYGVTLENLTPFTLSQLKLWAGGSDVTVDEIPPGATYRMQYNPSDPHSFISTLAQPWISPGSSLSLPILIVDRFGNSWEDSVEFTIAPFMYEPRRDTLRHVAGIGTGNFEVLVVDPVQFKNHTYVVLGIDSINAEGDPGLTLKDSTDGRVLLLNHPLPDALAHEIPITDGFKLLRGTTESRSGTMVDWTLLQGSRSWSYAGVTNVLHLEGYLGTIGNGLEHWPSGGVDYRRQHSVLVEFAPTDTSGNILPGNPGDTLASYGYRYLQNADVAPARPEFASLITNAAAGFAFQDFTRSVPFAAFDTDVNPPVRLAVGYLENNVVNGLLDGKYWPPVGLLADNGVPTGPREWFFIFDKPYNATPDEALEVDILTNRVPLMWLGYPSRSVSRKKFSPDPSNLDEFLIVTKHAPSSGDVWTLTLKREDFLPQTYTLLQNYPNPFNPNTTIRYTLPMPSDVTITIYNLLGQRVKTLMRGTEYAGEFNAVWDGKNETGVSVSSGVYFYRLEAKSLSPPGESFMQVRKMMVLR